MSLFFVCVCVCVCFYISISISTFGNKGSESLHSVYLFANSEAD